MIFHAKAKDTNSVLAANFINCFMRLLEIRVLGVIFGKTMIVDADNTMKELSEKGKDDARL